MLFFHGGAFILGSAIGHRKLSDKLSQLTNAAVLSVNYKMFPEHKRLAGIQDAQHAYRWILQNGPNLDHQDESLNVSTPCDFLLVAGDSAGGNLALMISSWTKGNTRRRPDAVIGFSPSLDMSMASPTVKSNRLTDYILGEAVKGLTFLPKPVMMWIGLLILKMKPSNPLVSPLFYELSELPETLIHASSSEVLLGEAIRYTNKAHLAGSDVKLQIWKNQLHDWHLFNMGTGSANSAWQQVEKFIAGLQPQNEVVQD